MKKMMRENKKAQMNRDAIESAEVVVSGIVLKQWKRCLGRYNMLYVSKDKTCRRVKIWVDPCLWDLHEHEAKQPEHVVLEGHYERNRRRFVATRILACREVEFFV